MDQITTYQPGVTTVTEDVKRRARLSVAAYCERFPADERAEVLEGLLDLLGIGEKE